jgi:hypothetical protein
MRTFAYSAGEYLLTFLVFGSFGAFSVFLALTQEHPIVFWLMAAVFLGWPFWAAWKIPTRFDVDGGVLTARWLGGRSHSWNLTNLTIPNNDRYRMYLVQGYIDAYEIGGRKAFRFYPQLREVKEFFELLAPGTQEAVEKRRRKSWWNREFL